MNYLIALPWEFPEIPPDLAQGFVHLWLAELETVPCREEWLNDDEKARLQGMQNSSMRRRFCATRTLLRRLLADYLQMQPVMVSINIDPRGKPRLAGNTVQFNLSHSGDWVLLAFSREVSLGVDIETCRPLANKAGIAQRLFSREDVLELQQQNYDTRHFFARWTRHEACQKCQGEGVFGQPADLSRIGMSTFEPTPGVIASLAWMGHSTHPAMRAFRINPDYPTLTPSL